MRTLVTALALVLLFAGCAPQIKGNPNRGERLHAGCVGCHGTERYDPEVRRVKSYGELVAAVHRWNDMMNPVFDTQEVADLIVFLNETYYRFE